MASNWFGHDFSGYSPLSKEMLWVEICLSSACDMPFSFSSKDSVRLWSLTKPLSKVTCLSSSLLMSSPNKLVKFWRWLLSPSWSCIQDSLFSSTDLLNVVNSSWTNLRMSLFIGCPKQISMPDTWTKNAWIVCSNLYLILNVILLSYANRPFYSLFLVIRPVYYSLVHIAGKNTFTGLLTNYFSFSPLNYKLGLVRTLLDQVYKINKSWVGFNLDVREGTFFLGREGLGNFFSKKVLALHCILIKKTPQPPPLGDWQKCDPPLTTTWYTVYVLRGMFHAVETSEHFACERKMFEY